MKDLKLFKLITPFFKPYASQVWIILLLLPISSFTYSFQPIIIQKAVDGPLLSGNLNALWIYVLYLALIVAINFFVQVYQLWLVNSVGQNLVADLRSELFSHLESMSMSWFDRTPVGRSVSRITSDVEQLAESFAGGLALVVLDVFNIMGIFIFMFYLNFKLSILISISVIPIILCSIYFQDKYRKANFNSRVELAKLNSFLQQNIVGISVVQVLNNANKSMEKFSEGNKKYFEANDNCVKADAQLSAIIEMISFIVIAGMIYLCSNIIFKFQHDPISIGVILAFLYYTQSLFEPLKNLTDRFTIVQSAFTAIERIAELLEEEPEILNDSSPHKFDLLNAKTEIPLIEFKDVWFKYSGIIDGDWVLKGLNLKINKGEKIAIVGKTGSGKSTIVKLLTRLYEVDKGSILINGINIKEFNQSELRKHLTVIHQDSYIFAGNLEENIKLGRKDMDLDMDFIEPLIKVSNKKITTELSERAGNISAGEEQVINFARALVTKPEFIILDEATAKIDLRTEATIQNILREFLQDKTAIIIAHRLETIKNSDLILVIDDGRVIEKGSHEGLIEKKNIYADLIKSVINLSD